MSGRTNNKQLVAEALVFTKSIIPALIFGLFMTASTIVLAMNPSHVSRWLHTGFHMHEKAYEDERVVLSLLKNFTFDLTYIGYFEDNDDVTWEKNIEASGSYKIEGKDIIFKIEVLVGTEDKDKPSYKCPFALNKKKFILSKCELLNAKLTYEFKRTDPDAFHFQ